MREIHLAPNCGCIQRQGVLCMPHMERNPRNAVATMVLHCIHTPTSCKKVPFICECLVNVIVNEFPLNSGCARNWISTCTTYRICTEFPCIHSVPITLHSYFSFGTPSRVFFSCKKTNFRCETRHFTLPLESSGFCCTLHSPASLYTGGDQCCAVNTLNIRFISSKCLWNDANISNNGAKMAWWHGENV